MAHNDTHAARKKGGAGKILLVVLLLLLLAVNIISRITMPWLQVEKEKNHE